MNILGLDLCLTSTGIAGLGWTDTMKTTKSTKKGQLDLLKHRVSRIFAIRAWVMQNALACHATHVFVEAPAFGRVGGHSHDRSGLWWQCVMSLWAAGVSVTEVNPSTLKKFILGSKSDRGDDGSKGSIRAELARRLPDYSPANDDEGDALVLLMIGHELLGQPMVKMPAANVGWLKAVKL